jgi:hypothetical protein
MHLVGGIPYYYTFKYRIGSTNGTSTPVEYTTVLRLAEQYLIRAEARARQGNMTGGAADLNIIRNRAGLSNYSGAMDQTSLINAIMHERQIELFAEWGHRWFDLIRTGSVDTVLGSPGNVCQSKGGTWSSNSKLYPISQTELTNDPNLTQNPAY